MARKFNYTGRRKVLQQHVRIEVTRISSGLGFDAELDLGGYKFPEDAEVWVEAYRKANRMHFDFGTISTQEPCADRALHEFDSPEGIQFRVRVTAVGKEHGKLLGVADRIKPSATPDSETYTTALLGLASAPLHGEVWGVQFEDVGPFLVIDDSIEDRQVVATSDAFTSLVLPAVFSKVLLQILVLEPDGWDEEDETEWQNKWLDFAQRIQGAGDLPERIHENRTELMEWIGDCTAAFGRRINSMKQFELMRAEGES